MIVDTAKAGISIGTFGRRLRVAPGTGALPTLASRQKTIDLGRGRAGVALMDFTPEQPWPLSECNLDSAPPPFFYHTLDFPDGTSVTGQWDIRGRFDSYIGNYPLGGKTVLDAGTATGFLAFSAERAGASAVTALDVRSAAECPRIPFHDSLFHRDRAKWIKDHDEQLFRPLKKGFWYAWHKLNSRVEVIYAPLDQLYGWDRTFDVVLAGAIIEHIADPISAIGAYARLANEAVIIAFTDILDTDEWVMRPAHDLSRQAVDFEWWSLSRGLYRQVFDNLGFTIEIHHDPKAIHTPHEGYEKEFTRPTLVARRKPPEEMTLPRSARPDESITTTNSGWRSRLGRGLSR